MASPGVIPRFGEYLSGWYINDSLLNLFLISLSFASIDRFKILRESVLLRPTPSGFQFLRLWFSSGVSAGVGGGGGWRLRREYLSWGCGGGGGGGLLFGCGGGGGGRLVLFGLGGGVESPGVRSLFMCQFHSSSSSAIFIHSSIFPSLFSVSFVVYSPVVLFLVVIVSVISLGMRVWSDRTSAFLLVVSTPPRGRRFVFHAVSICLGGWVVGPLMIFPR